MNVNDLFNRQNAVGGITMVKEAASPAGTTATAGTYYAVQFVTDCTPTVFTAEKCTMITNAQFPAGTVIYADVTAITCGANQVYALYKC